MIDWKAVQVLATVVREGGFDRAASKLCLTQSAVSQRVKQLEQAYGQALVVRSQPPWLTGAGQILVKGLRQVEMLESQLTYEMSGGENDTDIRANIAANADSLAIWLLDALEPLVKSTGLLIDMRVDDQEATLDMLRKGDVMACITSQEKAERGCNCFFIGNMRYCCIVSPEFRARYFSQGVSARTLLEAPCVEFNEKDALSRQFLKDWYGVKSHKRVHRVPSTEGYMDYIIRGLAWGMVPYLQARESLSCNLVEELVAGQGLDVPLYWHIWNLKTELSRTLTDAILRAGNHFDAADAHK